MQHLEINLARYQRKSLTYGDMVHTCKTNQKQSKDEKGEFSQEVTIDLNFHNASFFDIVKGFLGSNSINLPNNSTYAQVLSFQSY